MKNAKAEQQSPLFLRLLGIPVKLALVLGSLLLIGMLLGSLFGAVGSGTAMTAGGASDVTIMDRYDMFMTNQISNSGRVIV